MIRTHAFFLLFSLIFFTALAQDQHNLSGRVIDTGDNPLEYATVLLLTATDSAMVKGAITDQEGRYVFEEIETGAYRVAVSMVGYKTTQTQPFTVRKGFSPELPVIALKEGMALDGMTVTSSKPLYELKQDRMVVNVGSYPTMSGNTGLELLQKTPGVIVDRQNNSISIGAKGEALLMINDKIQRVPAEALFARLQGMRTENIERIEVIDQPPVRHDASGAAGIINIVLKKNEQQGTNGSLTLTGGYGQREKAGVSLNMNSRKGKSNWYGDYNYNRNRANNYEVNHFREYDYQGDDYYYENFVTLHNYRVGQHTANLGLDVDFDGRTVIGLLLGGSLSEKVWASDGDSRSFDYINDDLIREADYLFSSKTDMSSLTGNINLFQKIGPGSNLDFDLDYANIRYDNSGSLQFLNEKANQEILSERSTPMEFWIVSLDNANQLGFGWEMETGIKGTFNNTTSATEIQTNEDWNVSTLFSGTDRISERILAAYISFSRNFFEKLYAELGMRYEDYNYRLERSEGNDIKTAFKSPFPVIRLNYTIDSVNNVQFGFNRSITRPSFFYLTSFLALLDPSLIVYANPQLKPTFANTFKISWQHNSAILSLAYLWRTDQIYFYNTVDKENHLQTSVPTNLDLEKMIEANLSFPLFPTHWWEINWSLNAYYHKVRDVSSRPLEYEENIFTYAVQFNSAFQLGNDWSVGVDGRYMSRFMEGDQVKYNSPYFNLGIRKKFPSGSSLNIAIQDIANTAGKKDWEYRQPELGIRTFGNNDFSERQLRVTYTLLFGNQKLSGKRKRTTGTEEEVNSRM